MTAPPSLVERIVLSFRVLVDPLLAARVRELVARPALELPAAPPSPAADGAAPPRATEPPSADRALSLLALLQREGRLVDFLEQDIAAAADADIGAAARIVHEGCRKAIRAHFEIAHVRTEAEGSTVDVPAGFDGRAVKLSGDVRGAPPYRGVLRHAGWRAASARLPEPAPGHDPSILAPAEVEL